MSRYVVINADDFGYSDSVNEAIITAHHQGILTSTSLMVTGKKAQFAVDLAKQNPSLAVGLHLVLCLGKSALPFSQIPHLVDKHGYFNPSAAIAGLKYQFIPQAKEELKQEIKAQLDLFKATNLPLSHVDGHLHLHTHPIVLQILAELASEYNIKFIRLPYEELEFTLNIDSSNVLLKRVYSFIFTLLRKYGENLLNNYGIKYTEKIYGLLQTGKINESYLLGLIPQIQDNIIEIYSHPQSISSDIELQALCSQEVKDLLSSKGFKLINYHQLEEKLSRC
ncbi:hopanoid biosynthesis-associated protein HpnK [Geminocystis sp. NIES-3709]|uniref:hopanoid biosynthesis-associated protein HpnK n=1 Tax=Geminocystis sp. NIES-3709 TaxID=1617448 RepID=UPI0005FC816F|nr:hopanoid biosynthesis-associated protein HpnK [Geminocystis sp. NIES-3709]BAQ66492.1 cellobiose phosphotransferase system YdjC-like protein [Geminocystis sp. NIES-3709]